MSLQEQYLSESIEQLEEAERILSSLADGNHQGPEAIQELFRLIHTIKGSAGYIGDGWSEDLAHGFESILTFFQREEDPNLPDDILDLLLNVIDHLRIHLVEPEKASQEERQRLCESLDSLRERTQELVALDTAGQNSAFEKKQQEVFQQRAHLHVQELQLASSKLRSMPSAELVEKLSSHIQNLLKACEYMGEQSLAIKAQELANSWLICQEAALTAESLDRFQESLAAVEKALAGPHVSPSAVITPVAFLPGESEVPPDPTDIGTNQLAKAVTASIRVRQDLLDQMVEQVGELIVTRNTLEHISKELFKHADHLPRELLKLLRESIGTLRHISENMQTQTLDMRLTNLHTVFKRVPSLIREVARRCEKQVRYQEYGSETMVDRSIAEQLSEPLIHLIRNAVDHGIETPQERIARGKDPKGTVSIRSRQLHDTVVITIEDDGAGISLEKVKRRALELGFFTSEQLQEKTDSEIIDLIFLPGFSTKQDISDISGRGVGMDVVRSTLEKFKGKIEVKTQINQGTSFVIELPIRTSMFSSLLFCYNEDIFAIPLHSVSETFRVEMQQLKTIGEARGLTLRNEILLIYELSDFFQLPARRTSRDERDAIVVVIQGSRGKFGLLIDRIQSCEEIVVKPLDSLLQDVKGLMGASILGDGRAILILDPDSLSLQRSHGGSRRSFNLEKKRA